MKIEELLAPCPKCGSKDKIAHRNIIDNHRAHAEMDTVKCEETNNILNPIDFEQYQVLIGELEALGLEKAETEGIYQAAEDNIKVIINWLFAFVILFFLFTSDY